MNEKKLEEIIEDIWMIGVEHEKRTVPEMDKLMAKDKAAIQALYKDGLREELKNWRNSVHENTGARGGAQIKGFNTAVRYYRENIDERLAQLNRKED